MDRGVNNYTQINKEGGVMVSDKDNEFLSAYADKFLVRNRHTGKEEKIPVNKNEPCKGAIIITINKIKILN